MQSLNIEGCINLRLPAIAYSEAGIKRQWVNCRNRRRGNWCSIVACRAERNGNGWEESENAGSCFDWFMFRSHYYVMLKRQMEEAAKSEDYKEASRLRDLLKCMEKYVPVVHLRRLLKEAIADERFEDAARYRDQLEEISPCSFLKCSSDTTTSGIRVEVLSAYLEGRSQPSNEQYFFSYRITITNNTNRPVQLLRRHLIITDANGKIENLWGVGVVGEQPAILPRSSFEYSSSCPLSTESGKMEGDFEMIHVDQAGPVAFRVAIAPFSFSQLGDDDGETI